jgi:hypothetical protein
MPISIAGSGTITGISAGGLPDDSVTTAEIAAGAVTPAKLSTGAPTWDTSSRVGIGTSSPSSLNSNANQLVVGSGTGSQGLTVFAGSASDANIFFADGTTGSQQAIGYIQYRHASDRFDFGTNDTTRMSIASDGSFSSVIPGGSTLYPRFGCRAWVNFNGTGTVAIRASGNVSSITDNGVGDYTVNFTTAMVDANYAASIVADGAGGIANAEIYGGASPVTAGALRIAMVNDHGQVHVNIIR